VFKGLFRKAKPAQDFAGRAYGILFRGKSEAEIQADVERYREAFGLRPIEVKVKPIA
jgi:hypothetical protein